MDAPEAVRLLASRIFPSSDVATRLLNNPAMHYVWMEVGNETKPGRVPVLPSTLDRVHRRWRLNTWEIPEDHHSPNDIACAWLFAFSVNELQSERRALARTAMDARTESWVEVASECRKALAGEMPDPTLTPELRSALIAVAEYFDDQGAFFSDTMAANSYFIGKTSGDSQRDLVRGRATAIARESGTLFGTPLYGTVAALVSIGLELHHPISAKDVENWAKVDQKRLATSTLPTN